MTSTIEIFGGNPVLIDLSSSFFDVSYTFTNGLGEFGISGPLIDYGVQIVTETSAGGVIHARLNSLQHDCGFNLNSTFSSEAFVLPDTFTLINFSGTGIVQETINAGDVLEKGRLTLAILIDAEYIWLQIVDDRPEPKKDEPNLKVIAVGKDIKDPSLHRLLVKNFGNVTAQGTTWVYLRPAYRPWHYIGDSDLSYYKTGFRYIKIEPGKTVALDVRVPGSIPSDVISVFEKRRNLLRGNPGVTESPFFSFCFVIKVGNADPAYGWSAEYQLH